MLNYRVSHSHSQCFLCASAICIPWPALISVLRHYLILAIIGPCFAYVSHSCHLLLLLKSFVFSLLFVCVYCVFVFIVCVCRWVYTCHCACVWVRGQLMRVGFLLLKLRFQALSQVVRPLVPSVFTSEPSYQTPAFSLLLVDSLILCPVSSF